MSGDDEEVPRELAQAGEMVERLIGHLAEKQLPPLAIASALLGGSIGLMARTLGREAVVEVLGRALQSVRSGELDEVSGRRPDG